MHQLGVFALFQTEPPIQSFRALKIILWDDRREEIVAKQRSHGWVFMETEENDSGHIGKRQNELSLLSCQLSLPSTFPI